MRGNRLLEKWVRWQWGSPVEGVWLERLCTSLRLPARCPPSQKPERTQLLIASYLPTHNMSPIFLSGCITRQMVSLRFPVLCWPKLLLFKKNLPSVTGFWLFFGCAMQSRWWSCGIRLVAWTGVWSLALLGAWCIPANEGKVQQKRDLGLLTPVHGARPGFNGRWTPVKGLFAGAQTIGLRLLGCSIRFWSRWRKK